MAARVNLNNSFVLICIEFVVGDNHSDNLCVLYHIEFIFGMGVPWTIGISLIPRCCGNSVPIGNQSETLITHLF